MKNKILSVLAFSSAIALVGVGTNAYYKVNGMSIDDVHVSENPIVKYGENGQVLKFNDPDDPKNSSLRKINIKNTQICLFIDTENKIYDSEQINYTVEPYGTSTNGFVFKSSDPTVATVDQNGVVTAKKAGKCDITLTNALGTISSKTHVVVSPTVLPADIGPRKTQILNSQKTLKVDTILVEEQFASTKNVIDENGKVLRTVENTSFTQKIWASKDKSYFRITSDELSADCEDGSYTPYQIEYIFYTDDSANTYIFKKQGKIKNYLMLDTSAISKEKGHYGALLAVLANFFVSGSKIVTEQFDDALGLDYLKESKTFSPKKGDRVGMLPEDGQLSVLYHESNGGRVSQEQASSFGVPAGTMITVDDAIHYTWEDNLATRKNIVEELGYEVGNEKFKQTYFVDYYFHTKDVELVMPDISEYHEAQDMSEL